jgi:hypothetical protein
MKLKAVWREVSRARGAQPRSAAVTMAITSLMVITFKFANSDLIPFSISLQFAYYGVVFKNHAKVWSQYQQYHHHCQFDRSCVCG